MNIETTVHSEEARGAMLFRDETWTMEGNPPTPMKSAYNLAGDYVGDQDRPFPRHRRRDESVGDMEGQVHIAGVRTDGGRVSVMAKEH